MIIQSLDEIAANYDAIFCDLWGCLHNGVAVFEEAAAALIRFRDGGGRVVMITNAPRPRGEVEAQLGRLGAPRSCWDEIVTSGDAAQYGLMAGMVGTRVYHIGPERDLTFFTQMAPDIPKEREIELVPLADAEGIVCTGLFDDQTETPEDYRAIILEGTNRGLKMLCANPDVVVDVGDQRIYCAGAIAQAYEEAGGKALYFGKPHPPIYQLARKRLASIGAGTEDSRILCVGDGVMTDLAGAVGEGLDCLFVTGGLAAEETATAPGGSPDPERLAAFLKSARLSPVASIGRLR